MCGFTGFLDAAKRLSGERMERTVLSMAEAIAYRGPDDAGAWVDAEAGIALGHRRLSIIDLSPSGHQPMVSSNGRYVIAYNGEAYNFQEIRAELEQGGATFRGHSDTEVILEAWAAWGGERTVSRLIGMFAMAVWDRHDRSLTLVRDRLGIKPLYWGWIGDVLFFGSQPSSFTAHPQWKGEIDTLSLGGYLRHSYIAAPRSIYRGISKLEPGTLLEISATRQERKTRYWDMRAVAVQNTRARLDISDGEAEERLDVLLRDAVARRMVADVPLGAFLSGGIDSSTVVALMQTQSGRAVKSFSIGFEVDGYNEAPHAKAIARHLGTEHTELYVDPHHAREVLPGMVRFFDEPFADSSQIPTYLVSEMTRKHVTVSLSGDGGDEMFAGYNRYFWGETLWRRFGYWPKAVRGLGAGMIRSLSPSTWDRIFGVFPARFHPPQAGDKMYKLAGILSLDSQEALYRRLVSQWENPDDVAQSPEDRSGALWDESIRRDIPDFMERMQFLDAITYLPDDILSKVDRASMAVSLEARVPLLDHRVVEFAWSLPKSMKVRSGEGKWLLKQVLYRYVPKELLERPKMGFGVPIDHWLRHELRDWAEDLLDERSMREDGLFDPRPVREKWAEHLSGRRNWHYPLWNVLMFQAWKRHWGL